MDFVVVVLMDVFGLERKKAIQVMMEVHVRGRAVAGVYPKDVANLKLKMVENLCQAFQHPLLLELEKVEGPEEN